MKLDIFLNGEMVFQRDIAPTDDFSFKFSVDQKDEEVIQRGYTEEQYQLFVQAHQIYPGKKRGVETEFENLRKKHKKIWRTALPTFVDVIKAQAKEKLEIKFRGGFVPEWPMLSVWINQNRWEMVPMPTSPHQTVLNKGVNFKSI